MANMNLKEKAREKRGKEYQVSQVSHCPTVPLSHISNKKCNKKDNILIYNNLYKIHDSTWDNGTVGHLGHFCKNFSNNQHSQTARLRQTSHICS